MLSISETVVNLAGPYNFLIASISNAERYLQGLVSPTRSSDYFNQGYSVMFRFRMILVSLPDAPRRYLQLART